MIREGLGVIIRTGKIWLSPAGDSFCCVKRINPCLADYRTEYKNDVDIVG